MLLFILFLYNSKNSLLHPSHNKVDLYGIILQVDLGAQRCLDTWIPDGISRNSERHLKYILEPGHMF